MNMLELPDDLLGIIFSGPQMPHIGLVHKRFIVATKYKTSFTDWVTVVTTNNIHMLAMYWKIYTDIGDDCVCVYDEEDVYEYICKSIPASQLLRDHVASFVEMKEICFSSFYAMYHRNKSFVIFFGILWSFCCDNDDVFRWFITKIKVTLWMRLRFGKFAAKHNRPHIKHVLDHISNIY